MGKSMFSLGFHANDEDMIAGTKEGLEEIISMCKNAIIEKEAIAKELSNELGDIRGVKLVDEEYWEELDKGDSSNPLEMLTVIALVVTFAMGFGTIVSKIVSFVKTFF